MTGDMLKCRICGAMYSPCHTKKTTAYRWQDVACCPEHGEEYLLQILASRKGTEAQEAEIEESTAKRKNRKNS